MWNTHDVRRGRRSGLGVMLDLADGTGDFHRPWLRTPEIWRYFDDEAEILRDLQRQWSIELGGAMFAAIQSGDGDLTRDVASAYAEALARSYAVYKILEAHSDHPAIAAERTKEGRLLASAGVTRALTAA
jgi:hypothetical protein